MNEERCNCRDQRCIDARAQTTPIMAKRSLDCLSDELLHLNICGQHYSISEKLVRAHPATLLARMLDGGIANRRDADGRLYFDRDPTLFARNVLRFYCNDVLPEDEDEAAFWHIQTHDALLNKASVEDGALSTALHAELVALATRSSSEMDAKAEQFVRIVLSKRGADCLRNSAKRGYRCTRFPGWQEWPTYEHFTEVWQRYAKPNEPPTREIYEQETQFSTLLATNRAFQVALMRVINTKTGLTASIDNCNVELCIRARLGCDYNVTKGWNAFMEEHFCQCAESSTTWWSNMHGFSYEKELEIMLLMQQPSFKIMDTLTIRQEVRRQIVKCSNEIECKCVRYKRSAITISW